MEPDGRLGGVMATYDPKQGRKMKACAENHVNHSRNDAAAQAERLTLAPALTPTLTLTLTLSR